MEIDNADWGAFAVSKKILKGVPVAYSIRTQSFRELNGWRLISLYDSEEEQMDPNCYTIAAMTTLIQANPMLEVMTEISTRRLIPIWSGYTTGKNKRTGLFPTS